MAILAVLGFAGSEPTPSSGHADRKCAGLPDTLDFSRRTVVASTPSVSSTVTATSGGDFWTYHPGNASLSLDLSAILYLDDSKCMDESQTVTHFKVDLISVKKESVKTSGKRCRVLGRNSVVQSTGDINSTHPFHTFTYVQGLYYIRVSLCTPTPRRTQHAYCMANLRQTKCSDVRNFVATRPKNDGACHFRAPSDLTVNVTAETSGSSVAWYFRDSSCSVDVRAAVPTCTVHQDYDKIVVAVVRMGLDEPCAFNDRIDTMMADRALTGPPTGHRAAAANVTVDIVQMKNCSGGECEEEGAHFEHAMHSLWNNASYCLFFRPMNPHCKGDYGCLFYTRPLQCTDLLAEQGEPIAGYGRFKRLRDIVTEPVFIGVVSGTLFLSLALLAWTVIQCSKSKTGQAGGTPLISAAQSNGSSNGLSIKKAPPRSLTEDDLEHISR